MTTCARIDLVCGGFPCQPHSVAGKRRGRDDERHLWPEMFRIVRQAQPRWVVAENVPGLRTTAADEVLADLDSAGYAAWPLVVGAWAVGAPHRRDRVWIVAHRDGERRQPERGRRVLDGQRAALRDDVDGRNGANGRLADDPSIGPERPRNAGESPGRAGSANERGAGLADACGPGLAGRRGLPGGAGPAFTAASGDGAYRWPAGRGAYQHEWESPRTVEPGVGCNADGLPSRLVRLGQRCALKAYGNSIVPQVVAEIGRAILEVERQSAPCQGPDAAVDRGGDKW